MESILTEIKKLRGISAEDTSFDVDIIAHINSALMTLNQMGVGPEQPANITSELDTWNSIFGDMKNIQSVKTYIDVSVHLDFDPPTSSPLLEAVERRKKELEWRLNIQVETE